MNSRGLLNGGKEADVSGVHESFSLFMGHVGPLGFMTWLFDGGHSARKAHWLEGTQL